VDAVVAHGPWCIGAQSLPERSQEKSAVALCVQYAKPGERAQQALDGGGIRVDFCRNLLCRGTCSVYVVRDPKLRSAVYGSAEINPISSRIIACGGTNSSSTMTFSGLNRLDRQ